MKIIAELLAEAVEECITCDGTGRRQPPGYVLGVECVDCWGAGRMLTNEGHALIEFMERWLGPKFATADHWHSLH